MQTSFDMKTHLVERRMDLNLHTAFVSDDDVVVFPLWNLTGQMVGYQQYRPTASKERQNDPREGRYFTKRRGDVGVWGLESWSRPGPLFVVEGIFDAAAVTHCGGAAIALLANDPDKSTLRWLWTVRRFRKVVAVCDSDKAGAKLAKVGHIAHTVETYKDLGDAPNEYVTNMINRY